MTTSANDDDHDHGHDGRAEQARANSGRLDAHLRVGLSSTHVEGLVSAQRLGSTPLPGTLSLPRAPQRQPTRCPMDPLNLVLSP